MEENKVETIEVTEVNETEDVKEGLTATEYGVIAGLMVGGVALWEGGKLVWRKTEKPRSKVKNFVTGVFKKDKGSEAAEEMHEELFGAGPCGGHGGHAAGIPLPG